MTGCDVVKQLYNAPTPQKLERNRIDVDLFFESVNLTVALLSIVSSSSRLTPMQTARLLYMHGEGKWLVAFGLTSNALDLCLLLGTENAKQTLLLALEEMEQVYGFGFQVTQSMPLVGSGIPQEWLGRILTFSFECELVRSCGWVHVGKDSTVLTVVEAVSSPKLGGEKETRNVQMVSVSSDMSNPYELHINSNINKYYPLDPSHVPKTSFGSGINIVVLPTFTEAVCVGHATIHDLPREIKEPDSFKRYWWTHHGFRLSDDALKQLVKVQINQSLTLVYPLTCVWKLRPCFVPSYTKLYETNMNTRILSGTEWVRGLWQYMCGLKYVNAQSSKECPQNGDEQTEVPQKRHRYI